jgi:hypothetical protein
MFGGRDLPHIELTVHHFSIQHCRIGCTLLAAHEAGFLYCKAFVPFFTYQVQLLK